jgi:hypothetical protein
MPWLFSNKIRIPIYNDNLEGMFPTTGTLNTLVKCTFVFIYLFKLKWILYSIAKADTISHASRMHIITCDVCAKWQSDEC